MNSRVHKSAPPLALEVECSFAAVRRCAQQIRAYLADQGLAEKEIWACELAFVEGCNNAVQHTPPNRIEQDLLVELCCRESHIELRINDYTQGFDFPIASSLPEPDEERGRGIYLMRALMDQVDYIRSQSSNCLVLKKARTGI